MALRGSGMLAVFTSVKPRHELDYNEWYNREHVDERIGIPRIHRGRHYLAADAAAGHLAIYECATVEVLSGRAYLRVLEAQTAWTRMALSRVVSFDRLAVRILVDRAHGFGGALAFARFEADPAQQADIAHWLNDDALNELAERPGVVGGWAGINVPRVAEARAVRSGAKRLEPGPEQWLVFFEAADPKPALTAARQLISPTALKRFGIRKRATTGSYRLAFGNQ